MDGHTETLAEHGRELDDITGRLATVTGRLDRLETRIDQGFTEILRRLEGNPPSD